MGDAAVHPDEDLSGLLDCELDDVTEAEVRAHVEVCDGNTRLPQAASVPVDAASGRGLAVLDQITSGWRAEETDHGKVVAFDMNVPSPPAED